MIRVDMEQIRKAGRNTSGVKVVSVEKKDIVVSMAKCQKEESTEDENETTDLSTQIETENDNTLGLE
jgi:DNA gyrase subunit A